jgi:hypothetical protein
MDKFFPLIGIVMILVTTQVGNVLQQLHTHLTQHISNEILKATNCSKKYNSNCIRLKKLP